MRAGVVITGAFLLAIGFVLVGAGAGMRSVADECARIRCDDGGETLFMGALGTGLLYPGMLLGLAAIGIIVAGVLAEARAKNVPVVAASSARPCPSCERPLASDAKYCASCGASVAPLKTTSR
jgi:hypothetical protein